MLTEPVELALFDAFYNMPHAQSYDEVMQACAASLPNIEQFFESAMVMVDNLAQREARLLLLAMVYERLTAVAELELLHAERQQA